jgi:hypothetical protein
MQPSHENSSLEVCCIHLGGGEYHAAIRSCGNCKPASVVHVPCSSPQAHLDWDGATSKCWTLVHRNRLKIGWVMQYCSVSSLLGPNSKGEIITSHIQGEYKLHPFPFGLKQFII